MNKLKEPLTLMQRILNLGNIRISLEGLLTQIAEVTLTVSEFTKSWMRICISSKFSSGTDVAGPGTTL
jgi:hypothetical protein